MANKGPDLPMASQNTDDNSMLDILLTFGLSQEDLYNLSHYSAEELTVENLPGILQAYMKKKLSQKSSLDQLGHSVPPSVLHSRSGNAQRERLDTSASSQPVSHSDTPRVQNEWGYRSHSPSPPAYREKRPHERNRSPRWSPSLSPVSRSSTLHLQKARESYRSGSPSPPPVIHSGFKHLNKSECGWLSSHPSAFTSNSRAHVLDDLSEEPAIVNYSHGSSSKVKVSSQQVKETPFTFSDARKLKLDEFGQTYQNKTPVEEPKRRQHTQALAAPLQHHGEQMQSLSRSRQYIQEAQKSFVNSQLSRHQSEEQSNRLESTDFSSRIGTTKIQPQLEITVESQNAQQAQSVDFNQSICFLSSLLLQHQQLQGQQVAGPSVANLEQTDSQNPAVTFNQLQQEQMPSINIPHQKMQGSHGFQQHVPICAPPQLSGHVVPPQANPVTHELLGTNVGPSIPGYAGPLQANPLMHGPLGSDTVHPPFHAYAGLPPPTVSAHPGTGHVLPPFPEYARPPQINPPMPLNAGYNNAQPHVHGIPSPSPSGPPMFPPPQEFKNVHPPFPRIEGLPPVNPTMFPGDNCTNPPFPYGAVFPKATPTMPPTMPPTIPPPMKGFPNPDYRGGNTSGTTVCQQSTSISGYAGPFQANPLMHGPLGSDAVHPPFHAYAGFPPPPPTVSAHPGTGHVLPPFPENARPPQTHPPMPWNVGYNNAQPHVHGIPSPSPSGIPMFPPPQEFKNVHPPFPRTEGLPQRNPAPLPDGAVLPKATPKITPPTKGFPNPGNRGGNTFGKTFCQQSTFKEKSFIVHSGDKSYLHRTRILTEVSCTSSVSKHKKIEELEGHLEDHTHVTNTQHLGVQCLKSETDNAISTKPVSKQPTANTGGVKPADFRKPTQDAKPVEDIQPTQDAKRVDAKSAGIATITATVTRQASGVPTAPVVSVRNTILSEEILAAICNPKFLHRDRPTPQEILNYNGNYGKINDRVCHFCSFACLTREEMIAHRTGQLHMARRNAFGKKFATELNLKEGSSTFSSYNDFPITKLSQETISAIKMPKFLYRKQPTNMELLNYEGIYYINKRHVCYFCMDEKTSLSKSKLTRHLWDKLHIQRYKAFGIRFSKFLQNMRSTDKNDAAATTKTVGTADAKTSETDTAGAESVKSAQASGLDTSPNPEPSPSPAIGTSTPSLKQVTASTQPVNINAKRPTTKDVDGGFTVFVSGFGKETTVSKLEAFFRCFGEVTAVVIYYSGSGVSQRCGHVTFCRVGVTESLLLKAKQGLLFFEGNPLLVSPFSAKDLNVAMSMTARSKRSAVEPRPVVTTVAEAKSRDIKPGNEAAAQSTVTGQPLHATVGAPAEERTGDRGDATKMTTTTTPASTSKGQDAGLPGGDTKEAGRQLSCEGPSQESFNPSLQRGPAAKAPGETSNDAAAPKESELTTTRDSVPALSEKRGGSGPKQGEDDEPVSKKAKLLAKKTSSLKRAAIGMEFVTAGFYCKLCSSLFVKEESIRKHCYTQQHQQNLQKKEPC